MNSTNSAFPLTPVSRRDFLAVGGAGVVGLSLKPAVAGRAGRPGAVIQILLNGGASHLETFDPKPHAPREIRGPLHSIATRIPSVRFSECLPRLADRADRLVIVRSLFHEAAPIHETGDQLLRTGHLVTRHQRPSTLVETVLQHSGNQRKTAPAVEINLSGGQDHWNANQELPQFQSAPARVRETYGQTSFGERCWLAARMIEAGSKYVLVNTFDTLSGIRTWDAHGDADIAPATVFDYRDSLGPQLDQALSALLDDLQVSGLLQQTLLLCTGEMGRTPRLNEQGGRDHWTQAWSGLLAGGGLEGGQVIGETDEHGEAILNEPFPLAQFHEMAAGTLGLSPLKEPRPVA